MHPYMVQRLVEERQAELYRMARSPHGERRRWRRRIGQGLVALGLHLGLPHEGRAAARRQADCLLFGCDSA